MSNTYMGLNKGELQLIAACLGKLTISEARNLKERFDERIAELGNEEIQKRHKAYRDAVSVSDGELECDENAIVSEGDDPGAYVMTWTWVSAREAGIDNECNKEEDQ